MTIYSPEDWWRYLVPLLESQSYVRSIEVGTQLCDVDMQVALDLNASRRMRTIADAHLASFGMAPGLNRQWLYVDPKPAAPVVINRTDRYQNLSFPWRDVVKELGRSAVFVGLPHEYQCFAREFPSVRWYQTNDLLDVARVVAGCRLFVGNQSCCHAIAEGLKATVLQETCLEVPDCVFPRENARHITEGRIDWGWVRSLTW